MNCPTCQKLATKRGTYLRKSDSKLIQRFFCKECAKSFSEQTLRIDYRHRKRRSNQIIFRLLCSGVSQRRCAMIVGVKPEAISRRVQRYGRVAEQNLKIYRKSRKEVENLVFDELETFEHSKCKPLTVPIAVEDKSRKILAISVGQIAAKGHLSRIALKKYGYRKCHRKKVLHDIFSDLKYCCTSKLTIKSDQSHHYPKMVRQYFKNAKYIRYKGRRGCIVGQGELKRGGFDPLFSLNHSYAMFRDNLKTLSRRTWCTAKRLEGLRHLLFMYAWFHNLYLENPKRIVLKAI